MYIFFLNLWIWLQSCPTDGTVAEFLRDNIRCPERSQEWAAMVQDQHKVRQAVLWSRRLPEVTENTETASPILSGTGSCTTLSLFPGLFNSLIRYWEIQSTLFWQTEKSRCWQILYLSIHELMLGFTFV